MLSSGSAEAVVASKNRIPELPSAHTILQYYTSFTQVHCTLYVLYSTVHYNISLLFYPTVLFPLQGCTLYNIIPIFSYYTILHFYTSFSQVYCILYTCTPAVQYIYQTLLSYTFIPRFHR